eukprot:scaffold189215_cov19-Tisochrysis_lutea.AAC.1
MAACILPCTAAVAQPQAFPACHFLCPSPSPYPGICAYLEQTECMQAVRERSKVGVHGAASANPHRCPLPSSSC